MPGRAHHFPTRMEREDRHPTTVPCVARTVIGQCRTFDRNEPVSGNKFPSSDHLTSKGTTSIYVRSSGNTLFSLPVMSTQKSICRQQLPARRQVSGSQWRPALGRAWWTRDGGLIPSSNEEEPRLLSTHPSSNPIKNTFACI